MIADDSRLIVFELSIRFTAKNSDHRLRGVHGLAGRTIDEHFSTAHLQNCPFLDMLDTVLLFVP